MKQKCKMAKSLASIGIFAGVIIGGLGFAVRWHTGGIMENGRIHAVVTDVGNISADVRSERREKKRGMGEHRRYEDSYWITWSQDIGIKSSDTELERISLAFEERKMGSPPQQEDLISDRKGFHKNQELDIYIMDDGKAVLAERIDGNTEIANHLMLAGIAACMSGIGIWACILIKGLTERRNCRR